MAPELPQELREMITDCLHGDIDTLRQCSLVSRAWVERSRFHLFSTVRIRKAGDWARWEKIFDSVPHSLSYVVSLHHNEYNIRNVGDTSRLFRTIPRLDRLEYLDFGFLDLTDQSLEIDYSMLSTMTSLKKLRFFWLQSPTLHDAWNFISAFPNIQSLDMTVIDIVRTYRGDSLDGIKSLPFLRDITMFKHDGTYGLGQDTLLRSLFPIAHTLTTLRIHWRDKNDSLLNEFLALCVNLTKLGLQFRGPASERTSAVLTHNTALREFEIDDWPPYRFTSTLASLSSPDIRDIIMIFSQHLDPDDLIWSRQIDWETVDSSLSGPKCPCLQQLAIFSNMEEERLETLFVSRMPRLHAKKVLRFFDRASIC